MISTEINNQQELIQIGLKNKLTELYTAAGIPKKYHFANIETHWSSEYSPYNKLTGLSKKRSQATQFFITAYMNSLDSVFAGNGLKVKLKDSIVFVTDFFLDGSKSSGKTLLLSLIGQEAINKGYSVKYVEWAEYVDRFTSFESRNQSAEFFEDCLDCDMLIFDSLYDYDISNNKFFCVQLDRLISTRLNSAKVTLCSIDTINNQNPAFGFIWNKFSRETFTFRLPEAKIK